MNAAAAEILLSAIACVTFLMAVRSGVTTAEKRVRTPKPEVQESLRLKKRVLGHRPEEEEVDAVLNQMVSRI